MFAPDSVALRLFVRGGMKPSYPPELEGGIRRFLDERGQDLDRWIFAVRTIFAVGLVGFLSIDAFQAGRPTTLVVTVLAGYVVVNLLAWTIVGGRTTLARWLYMGIDVTIVVVARHLLPVELVVDPNLAMVGVFTLHLLTYAIYGDPCLTLALAGAALTATGGTVAADMVAALVPDHGVSVSEPLRIVLLIGYLAAFCLLTIGLSRRLRCHAVEHGLELVTRLQATMTTAVERNRREKIQELNRLKRDFISVLSHELRTPLTPLRSSLDMMRSGGDGALSESDLLEIALDSTEQLQRLVLDYTQLAELLTVKEAALARWNVELSGFIDVLRHGSQFRRVSTSGIEGLGVAVDPKLLAAGLLALLRRAQLVSTSSTISLCGFADSSGVTLSVHDPESYIDRDLSQMLDDPFSLFSERTFVSPNTGLELILARYALQRTGGTLRVISSEYHGTTAFCTVPGEAPGLAWLDRTQIEYELESLQLYAMR